MKVTELTPSGSWEIASGNSELGALAVAVRGGELIGVDFGHRTAAAAAASLTRRLRTWPTVAGRQASEHDQELAERLLERLQRFAAGDNVDFSDVQVALDHLSPFQRRVIKACRAIGRGQCRTYGQLAAAAGSRGAARAVGQVMAGNRTPLVVPCHRVVAASGLGGFSAPEGLAMKRRLLALEAATALGA